jgi:hypothetical protein
MERRPVARAPPGGAKQRDANPRQPAGDQPAQDTRGSPHPEAARGRRRSIDAHAAPGRAGLAGIRGRPHASLIALHALGGDAAARRHPPGQFPCLAAHSGDARPRGRHLAACRGRDARARFSRHHAWGVCACHPCHSGRADGGDQFPPPPPCRSPGHQRRDNAT